jgi:GntR family transcriptional regulator, arabinose operon transcriptional repressor
VTRGKPEALAALLEKDLRSGTWSVGDLLPSQNVLAERHGLSVPTVREALSLLRARGWIEQRRGHGTFLVRLPAPERRAALGMATSHMDEPFHAELVAAITRRAEQQEIPLFVNYGDNGPRARQRMHDAGIDALIVGPVHQRIWVERLFGPRVSPRTVLFGCLEDVPASYVGIDGAAGVREAFAYLCGLGHQRIALLTKETETPPLARGRLQGFSEARESWGLSDLRCPVCFLTSEASSLEEVIRQQLARPDPVTALLVHNDVLAIEALEWLRILGKRVPEDISVIGFDGISASKLLLPPLTTIDVRVTELGEALFELLLAVADSPPDAPYQHKILLPRLSVRGSTAPPPA